MEINSTDISSFIDSISRRRLKLFHKRQYSYIAKVKRLNKASARPILFKPFDIPDYWEDKNFNPFYVSKRKKYFSKVISHKIKKYDFTFSSPKLKKIKKDDGGVREISIFSIIDESVSLYFFTKLMRKNSYVFSNHSYAYQSNNSPHNAAQYITSEFSKYHRLYVAEFDFSKYFDSISHKYLMGKISENKYHITKIEKYIIQEFLKTSKFDGRGIPQGSALSLFLANVALEELDSLFETLNLSFVRFADDILIWGKSYEALNSCVEYIFEWSEKSLVDINAQKSHGIRILNKVEGIKSEFDSATYVSFLGFNFYLGKTTFSNKKINDIKKHIDQLIYIHLLKNPTNNRQDISRISNKIDKDYVALISELRRYIYGNLSNSKVNYYFRVEDLPEIPLSGFLPYYVSINEESVMKELDRYTLVKIYLALKKRKRILLSQGKLNSIPSLWDCSIDKINAITFPTSSGNSLAGEIPSFTKYHKLINKAVKFYGADILKFERNIDAVIKFY